jgi:hypothetical protein
MPPSEPEPDHAAETAESGKPAAEHLAQFSKSTPTQEDRHVQAAWAAGAATMATETATELPNMATEKRGAAAIWVAALNECAKDLMTGAPPSRPGDRAGFTQPTGI